MSINIGSADFERIEEAIIKQTIWAQGVRKLDPRERTPFVPHLDRRLMPPPPPENYMK